MRIRILKRQSKLQKNKNLIVTRIHLLMREYSELYLR